MPKTTSNWRNFFIRSLKQKVPISKDNLYVNEKLQKGGALSRKPIKIVSPSVQATNQARDTAKQGSFGDNEIYVNQRPVNKTHKIKRISKRRPKKRKTPVTKRKSKKKKAPSKKKTIRRYKKK